MKIISRQCDTLCNRLSLIDYMNLVWVRNKSAMSMPRYVILRILLITTAGNFPLKSKIICLRHLLIANNLM